MTTNAAAEIVPLSEVAATRVRGLMAEHRMNQDGLSLVLGVSRTAVSDRLRRVKDIDLDELPVLASAFGVSIEYLLGLTDVRGVASDSVTKRYSNVSHRRPAADLSDYRARRHQAMPAIAAGEPPAVVIPFPAESPAATRAGATRPHARGAGPSLRPSLRLVHSERAS